MKKIKVKKERLKPAKKIASAEGLFAKLEMLTGIASSWQFGPLDSKEKIFGMVDYVRRHVPTWSSEDNASLDVIIPLGTEMAIAIMEGNYKLFGQIASVLQFNRRPRYETPKRKLYHERIVWFCIHNRCGTKDAPCDGKALQEHLQNLGHRFNSNYPNELPSTLRSTCKRLGVILFSKGRGRPRKNSRK